jgi:hypothetical protein
MKRHFDELPSRVMRKKITVSPSAAIPEIGLPGRFTERIGSIIQAIFPVQRSSGIPAAGRPAKGGFPGP